MNVPAIAFFNNKGGVGKTSLVYHLAWMYADLGLRVVVADLDPQANLTAAFLDEDRLEQLWPEGDHPDTISGCIQPLRRGTGDIADPHLEDVVSGPQLSLFSGPIALLVGDLLLSSFEDSLSNQLMERLDHIFKPSRELIATFKGWHMKLPKEHIYHYRRCFDAFHP